MPKNWLPDMPLPPWSGNDDAMRAWVLCQLEKFYRARPDELRKEATDPESGDATIIELFDSSDRSKHEEGLNRLGWLASRLLGPEIADRIQWRRKRGHPKAKAQYSSSEAPKGLIRHPIEVFYDRPSRIRMAKLAVPKIQNFWREHYDGKWTRGRGKRSAYEIAAQYFAINEDIDEADVKRKPSGRRKKLRAKD
jgi:hypothetical protein